MSAIAPVSLESLVQLAPVLDRARQQNVPTINDEGGFRTLELNLSDSDLAATGAGRAIEEHGYGVVFRVTGSNPAARLTIECGGEIRHMPPGDFFLGKFHRFTVKNSTLGAAVGTATLLVLRRPDVLYRPEGELKLEPRFDPVDLLGSSSAGTFVSVTEDTQPSGAAPTGSFDISGWSQIRVLIDGQTGGSNATSFDLIPWLREPNSGLWFEQGAARIAVPDSAGTGYRYRVLTLDVGGDGLMYLEIRNLLAAARTGLGFMVQALK